MNTSLSRRSLLSRCMAAVPVGLVEAHGNTAASILPAGTEPAKLPRHSRKPLSFLRARVKDTHVLLTAYKSTPEFEKPTQRDRFRAIRIYRQEEPDFVFGQDYSEFFDGLSPKTMKPIFEGPLKPGNNRKFTYVDEDVHIGSTYAYWMAPAEGEPTGPVAVKVRDPEVWWPRKELEQSIDALAAKHARRVEVTTIGRTVLGRPIRAIRLGQSEPCLAFVGTVHAGESGPELLLPIFDRILSEHPSLLTRASIAAIPALGIDERERLVEGVPWYLRTNADGVDLNRNFPADWSTIDYSYGLDSSDPDSATYQGPSPASEPETEAAISFLREVKPCCVFSFHCLASICGACFLGPKCGASDREYVSQCRQLAIPYARGIVPEIQKDNVLRFGTSPGSLPAWCYRELHMPAFDLEISNAEKDALGKCKIDRTDRPLLEDYRQRHTRGILAVLRALAGDER